MVQHRIVQVVEASLLGRGYSPSIREIGDAVGLASTSSVSYQLGVLEAKGRLARDAGRPRTLRVPGLEHAPGWARRPEGHRIDEVPVVGRIAAGDPVLAVERAEDVMPLPRMLTGEGSLLALKVAGDSMIGALIADGDWVVVRRQPDAENGEIVAAMVPSNGSDDYEATVKTLKKADGHTWLIPHNPAYSPIMADTAIVIGRVVNVLRRLLPEVTVAVGTAPQTTNRPPAGGAATGRCRAACWRGPIRRIRSARLGAPATGWGAPCAHGA